MKTLFPLFIFSLFLFLSCSNPDKDKHIIVIDTSIRLPKDTIITIDPMSLTINIETNSISVDFDHATTELKDIPGFKKFIARNNSRTNKKFTRIKCDPDVVIDRLDSVMKVLTENHFERIVLVK